ALCTQRGQCRARHEEDVLEVDPVQRVPVLRIGLGERLRAQIVPDFVHEHVDPLLAREHAGDPRGDLPRLADVDLLDMRALSLPRSRGCPPRPARPLRLPALRAPPPPPGPPRAPPPAPPPAAGHERAAVGEPKAAISAHAGSSSTSK